MNDEIKNELIKIAQLVRLKVPKSSFWVSIDGSFISLRARLTKNEGCRPEEWRLLMLNSKDGIELNIANLSTNYFIHYTYMPISKIADLFFTENREFFDDLSPLVLLTEEQEKDLLVYEG